MAAASCAAVHLYISYYAAKQSNSNSLMTPYGVKTFTPCVVWCAVLAMQVEAIQIIGKQGLWRFCQQCGKLEELSAFAGDKRCV